MEKILIYDNPDEFLQAMDYLQKEYNKKYENQTPKGESKHE